MTAARVLVVGIGTVVGVGVLAASATRVWTDQLAAVLILLGWLAAALIIARLIERFGGRR